MNENGLNNQKTNSKAIIVIVIVAIVVVIGIVGLGFFGYIKFIKSKNVIPPINNSEQTENDKNDNTTNNSQNNSGTTNNGNTSDTVDASTDLTNDKTGPFLMAIEDVFTITNRGTVVTGSIERGTVKLNDEVQIIGLGKETITTTVAGIEMFKKDLDYAEAGDNVGILLSGIEKDNVERGQVLAVPNSIKAATKFDADVYIFSKEEGGRHTPFFSKYRPQFNFRATDITGVIELPEGVEMVNPGENAKMTVELVMNVAMEVGTEFSIREGGRTVGKGTVTKIY